MSKKKYTFESDFVSTKLTTVEANSVEEAKKTVLNGNCEWTAIEARGGELINIHGWINQKWIKESKHG